LILFVTDSNAIRRVSSTGTCLTIAGSTSAGYEDGPAATAAFSAPSGVVLDKFEQSLYIADLFNNVVRRLDLTTMMVYTVIGTGDFGWTSAPISYNANVLAPRGLCIDPVSQRLFVSGANSLSFAEVYTLTTTGSLVTSTSRNTLP
jgi:DNA-binding beta-propeller fold protein YncE